MKVAATSSASSTAPPERNPATYEYSPIVELIRVSGEMGMKNTIRYSSRYTDDGTGLLYYGFHYYYPALGKWLSSDPIEESGGMNVFGFLQSLTDDLAGRASFLAEVNGVPFQ